jgi:hypothetical protein
MANAAGILTAVAGAITAAFFGLRWCARKLRSGKPPDPDLSDPPLADRSQTRYSARAVELLGRDEDMPRLQGFLRADAGFLWMQVAGVGGQGKSRLGWKLILWARDHGWQPGLLERVDLNAFAAHWATWRPRRPRLLVLDYVIGPEAAIKPVIQSLAGRAADLRKLPLSTASAASTADGFLSPVKSLFVLDCDLETDDWRRFAGCLLYGNGIFRSTFKLHRAGMVEMEGDVKIAADLPIRTRYNDGIFRSPLLDPAEG